MRPTELIATRDREEELTFVTTNTSESLGHKHWVLGDYFDRYWVPILGPTASILLRWIIRETHKSPDGQLRLTTAYLASAIGRPKSARPVGRSIERLARFQTLEVVTASSPHVIAAKTHLTQLSSKALNKLHPDIQIQHDQETRALVGQR